MRQEDKTADGPDQNGKEQEVDEHPRSSLERSVFDSIEGSGFGGG